MTVSGTSAVSEGVNTPLNTSAMWILLVAAREDTLTMAVPPPSGGITLEDGGDSRAVKCSEYSALNLHTTIIQSITIRGMTLHGDGGGSRAVKCSEYSALNLHIKIIQSINQSQSGG